MPRVASQKIGQKNYHSLLRQNELRAGELKTVPKHYLLSILFEVVLCPWKDKRTFCKNSEHELFSSVAIPAKRLTDSNPAVVTSIVQAIWCIERLLFLKLPARKDVEN